MGSQRERQVAVGGQRMEMESRFKVAGEEAAAAPVAMSWWRLWD